MSLDSAAPRFPAKPLGLRRPACFCLLALAGFLPLTWAAVGVGTAGPGGGGDEPGPGPDAGPGSSGGASPGSRFRDCAQCPEMVVVPAGSFMMGAPESEAESHFVNERPVHRVAVRSFAAGAYEVTFAEWDACIAGGGCGGHRPDDRGWGRGRRPVVDVSWDDAQLYVRWLSSRTGHGYRLLSEAEWEYAARAGTTGPFHTGGTISPDQANYNGQWSYPFLDYDSGGVHRKRTVPVGAFGGNAFGLYDVHGNAWEWVQDCWRNVSYQGAPSDGRAWESGDCSARVLRGGSYFNYPGDLRSANRNGNSASVRGSSVGFRVARTLSDRR